MRELLKFFSLTYIVSWILWIAAPAILRVAAPQPSWFLAVSGFLYLLGVFAPALVALALTARADGRAGTLALLGRTVKWSVRARWYVLEVGYMAAIKLAAALLLRIATGAWLALFIRLKEQVREALGDGMLLLEHVGSTSVPGLLAKPIIDMVLAVADSSDELSYVPLLEKKGYILRNREPDWYEHRLLKSPDVPGNLHVFSDGCEEIEQMLLFRD
jgi:hypothetical protein